MSLYNIALVVFFVAVGLFLLAVDSVTNDFTNLCSTIAGVAALVCGGLLLFDRPDRR